MLSPMRLQRTPQQRKEWNYKRALVWEMTEGRCFYCGSRTNPFMTFHVDHVEPIIKGGTDKIENLVPCCKRCNLKKGAGTIYQLEERLGKELWFRGEDYRKWYYRAHQGIVDYYNQRNWSALQYADMYLTEELGALS